MTQIDKMVALHYGYETQSNQLIEEMAELTVAIRKYERACGRGQQTPVTKEDAKANLIEELADVQLVLEHVIYLMNCEKEIEQTHNAKLNRTIERIYQQQGEENR